MSSGFLSICLFSKNYFLLYPCDSGKLPKSAPEFIKVYEYEKNSRNQLTKGRFFRKINKICHLSRMRRTPPRKKRDSAGEKRTSPAEGSRNGADAPH